VAAKKRRPFQSVAEVILSVSAIGARQRRAFELGHGLLVAPKNIRFTMKQYIQKTEFVVQPQHWKIERAFG
jgi:hypothetical protein